MCLAQDLSRAHSLCVVGSPRCCEAGECAYYCLLIPRCFLFAPTVTRISKLIFFFTLYLFTLLSFNLLRNYIRNVI